MAKKKQDKIDEILDALLEETPAKELLKNGSILKELQKAIVERALEAEMTEHMGYPKDSQDGINTGNWSAIIINTDRRQIELPPCRRR